jgi:hypothetical protein
MSNDFKDKKCSHHLFVARGEGYSMFSQVWEKHMRACRNNWDKLWHMHKSLSSQRKMNGCFIWMICSNVSAFQKYSITQTTKMLFIGFSRWENSLNVQEFTEKSLASCAHGAGINQSQDFSLRQSSNLRNFCDFEKCTRSPCRGHDWTVSLTASLIRLIVFF